VCGSGCPADGGGAPSKCGGGDGKGARGRRVSDGTERETRRKAAESAEGLERVIFVATSVSAFLSFFLFKYLEILFVIGY